MHASLISNFIALIKSILLQMLFNKLSAQQDSKAEISEGLLNCCKTSRIEMEMGELTVMTGTSSSC